MRTLSFKVRMLLTGLLIGLFSIALSAQDFHLELIEIIHETPPGSQPVTRFYADGSGGKAAFTIRHRTEGRQKKMVVWSFLNDIDLINLETGTTPDIRSISLVTDDTGSWDFPRWRTSKKAATTPVKTEFSGKPSKQLKKYSKKYKRVYPVWVKTGQDVPAIKQPKNKTNGESTHLLKGTSRRFYPLKYTSFSIRFSTREYADYEDFFEVEVVYIFRIKAGPGKRKKSY